MLLECVWQRGGRSVAFCGTPKEVLWQRLIYNKMTNTYGCIKQKYLKNLSVKYRIYGNVLISYTYRLMNFHKATTPTERVFRLNRTSPEPWNTRTPSNHCRFPAWISFTYFCTLFAILQDAPICFVKSVRFIHAVRSHNLFILDAVQYSIL